MTAPETCDLVVIGSGAAGLSAAVTAAHEGLKVVLLEKAPVIGGTTAWSGGWMWVPRNPLAVRAGIVEDIDAPRRYLAQVLGNNFDDAKVDAFLRAAPEMVGFFESATAVRFEGGTHIPDTYGQVSGAGKGGRSVIAAPFDGRALGKDIALLRKPLAETAFMGMTIQAGADLRAFMTMTRSPRAFAHVSRRFGRHLVDLALHGRGMQLRNGNALVARLLKSARDLGVDLRTSVNVKRLCVDGARVCGVEVETAGGAHRIVTDAGVVLATGGVAHDMTRLAPLSPADTPPRTLATPFSTGGGAALAEAVGAAFDGSVASASAYCPVSEVPKGDGSTALFPHIIERGKPGIIGVLRDGKRFCNEGNGYHDYVVAMLAATPAGEIPESWLICTRAFQRRYGLGISRPRPVPVGPYLRSGYIRSGRTVADLARACGIDPAGLKETLETYNADAREGRDPAFGRGTTPYNRLRGDPAQTPNPCVAPIETGPFYAVKVIPGSFGTFAGLKTNGAAEVLRADGSVIGGLYAAGCDMASVMGGHYPAGGINIGPAMTFGYIAGRRAAGSV
ncbi:FAD-dependent oxidoreductase [Sedimentitalea sp. JM2-8]|uniref:FAD-dependent oxidoreductase n=1 Tax=Sedimentitalea xiamensis TaxID=3050037 RepID=A0ABT7FFJ1_9RHOB|nr:FAD-dependent oxidoreductase [Sedimentitalea xiamensis]MDK3073830.1 FAD-dependent oxidoreductase [Sedimentitalea xiamensis]